MKNAIFLTGAAARISQEVALIDKLIDKKGLQLSAKNTMLAGYSSGALNIAAINACFRDEAPMDWDKYYKEKILFNTKTATIFKKSKFIPFNTRPLRITVRSFLNDTHLRTLNDFSFQSFILTFSFWRLSTLWTSNCYNRHRNINILDLLMATTAIPFIFPDQTIKAHNQHSRRFIQGHFADGGTGGSFKRFEYHLKKYMKQNGQLNKLYIISPMREVSREDYEEVNKMIPAIDLFKMDIKDLKILRFFMEMISQNGFDTFIKRFHKWTLKHQVAKEIYICIPQLENNYPILNFDLQKEQYDAVCEWIDNNPQKLAIPLNEYVKRFDANPIEKIQQSIRRNLKHRIRSFRIK
jgi:hypothetical protein